MLEPNKRCREKTEFIIMSGLSSPNPTRGPTISCQCELEAGHEGYHVCTEPVSGKKYVFKGEVRC